MRHLCSKRVRRRAPRNANDTCLPSGHFACFVKIKANCVIGASFACHPPFRSPPFKNAQFLGFYPYPVGTPVHAVNCKRKPLLGGGKTSIRNLQFTSEPLKTLHLFYCAKARRRAEYGFGEHGFKHQTQ